MNNITDPLSINQDNKFKNIRQSVTEWLYLPCTTFCFKASWAADKARKASTPAALSPVRLNPLNPQGPGLCNPVL